MDSIQDSLRKIKDFFKSLTAEDIYIVLIIILVAIGSFGLGRFSRVEEGREKVSIHYPQVLPAQTGLQGAGAASALNFYENTSSYVSENTSDNIPEISSSENKFVGSKNSDKYHYPWCSGAKRIKEENKVWFSSREEAKAAGYVPAGNCEGL